MTTTVFAWGNPSRGDDAAGPWLAEVLRRNRPADVLLVEDFQLQVEHLLDCRAAGLLLFLDARADPAPGVLFREVTAVETLSHTSHALAPAELLGYYSRTFRGEQPPPAFELSVAGNCFELGSPMSAATHRDCQQAADLINRLLQRPEPRAWRQLLTRK
ncbi:hydrogenase maturation protease [Pseudohalioglobus sediminis]|uniref:Hydrogenase maturation protease n=1 Tax=Pseudohalioglobus sediminis TaxID=2606449 RepID=A0A5B0WLV4_9GAMM|nr:hydrogenase maturation protease [Pseudohalioglobus sediminis]KAA1187942.1 hydrogenase maturation protease [Pseudohalioglobus sediminis]